MPRRGSVGLRRLAQVSHTAIANLCPTLYRSDIRQSHHGFVVTDDVASETAFSWGSVKQRELLDLVARALTQEPRGEYGLPARRWLGEWNPADYLTKAKNEIEEDRRLRAAQHSGLPAPPSPPHFHIPARKNFRPGLLHDLRAVGANPARSHSYSIRTPLALRGQAYFGEPIIAAWGPTRGAFSLGDTISKRSTAIKAELMR